MGEEQADRVGQVAEGGVSDKRAVWDAVQREDPALAALILEARKAFGASVDFIAAGGLRYGSTILDEPFVPQRPQLPPRLPAYDGKVRPPCVPDTRGWIDTWRESEEVIAFQARGNPREAARIRKQLRRSHVR